MCFFNQHNVTGGTGIPVLNPVAGANCDCGEMVVYVDSGSGARVFHYSQTGRLVGR